MNVYLGMQANGTAALNKAIVYSNFGISGSGTPFSDNFLTDTVLATNIWLTSQAAGAAGVLVVPASSKYWLSWTLPDGGFSSEAAPTLSNPLAWTTLTGPKIAMNGIRSQLIAASDLPVGNAAFLRLIKRTYTQLQVLLPGETAAPNTSTGKTGTPILETNSMAFDVIVNAVDATFNVCNNSDQVQITDPSDANFLCLNGTDTTQTKLNLANGTATFSVEFTGNGSSQMIVTDQADTSKIGTSSMVTY